MSRLEELIRELCPDGVEYRCLGSFASVSRGGSFQKKDFKDKGFPCIHYGQIYTHYGLFANEALTFVTEKCAQMQKKAVSGDIIMAVTSENIEDVCKCLAWLGDSDVAVSGHTAIIHYNQDAKYLTYYFHSEMFFQQKRKIAHGTKVIEVTPDRLLDIIIPVPPLPVQREIVRILDSFTDLTAELEAELEARKKQYSFYSSKLLEQPQNHADVVSLSSLGRWIGGKTPSMSNKEYWEDGTIPWISSKDMKENVLVDTEDHITERALENGGMTLLPEGIIAMVTRSGILKHTLPIAYIPFRTTINQDIKALIVREGVSSKYVFHVLLAYAEDIRRKTKKQGGTVDSLEFQKVMNYRIPLPTPDIQNRIVNVLDNFDAICSDLNIGLPAEINARQKQYEYYRDKLLTVDFAEATISSQSVSQSVSQD